MTANQAMFAISTMSKTLSVSRAGYYAWRGRAPSARSLADAALTDRIRAINVGSRESGACPGPAPRVRRAFMLNSPMKGSMWVASVSEA